jgi:hypothetical protein
MSHDLKRIIVTILFVGSGIIGFLSFQTTPVASILYKIIVSLLFGLVVFLTWHKMPLWLKGSFIFYLVLTLFDQSTIFWQIFLWLRYSEINALHKCSLNYFNTIWYLIVFPFYYSAPDYMQYKGVIGWICDTLWTGFLGAMLQIIFYKIKGFLNKNQPC